MGDCGVQHLAQMGCVLQHYFINLIKVMQSLTSPEDIDALKSMKPSKACGISEQTEDIMEAF